MMTIFELVCHETRRGCTAREDGNKWHLTKQSTSTGSRLADRRDQAKHALVDVLQHFGVGRVGHEMLAVGAGDLVEDFGRDDEVLGRAILAVDGVRVVVVLAELVRLPGLRDARTYRVSASFGRVKSRAFWLKCRLFATASQCGAGSRSVRCRWLKRRCRLHDGINTESAHILKSSRYQCRMRENA